MSNGFYSGISDNEHPINSLVNQYIDKMRFLEYDVKEDKKDFPPFMKARISKYWASSTAIQRTKQANCRHVRECSSRSCRTIKKCTNYYTNYIVEADNVKDNKAWLSSGVHDKNDLVIYKVTLDRVYRLSYIYISWAKKP